MRMGGEKASWQDISEVPIQLADYTRGVNLEGETSHPIYAFLLWLLNTVSHCCSCLMLLESWWFSFPSCLVKPASHPHETVHSRAQYHSSQSSIRGLDDNPRLYDTGLAHPHGTRAGISRWNTRTTVAVFLSKETSRYIPSLKIGGHVERVEQPFG